MTTCDACRREREGLLTSSCLGAVSFFICQECIEEHAEPLWAAEATIWSCGGIDRMNDPTLDGIKVFHDSRYMTIREYGNTDFCKGDIERIDKEYCENYGAPEENEYRKERSE